jgi:MraZ protein
MFMGEYQHTIDAKGRLFIPARFRQGLGDRFVLTKGLDGCLFAYPLTEWDALEQKLKSLPFTKGDARAFVRFFSQGLPNAKSINRAGY